MKAFNPDTGKVTLGANTLGIRSAELSATVIRADGRVEELGVIAETTFSRSRFRSFLNRLGDLLCRKP